MNTQAAPHDNNATLTGTKLRLFNAALDLFSTRGYGNVGVRDIAAAVNIKSASIYAHFENKDAFLEAAFDFFMGHYTPRHTPVTDLLALIPATPPKKLFEDLLMVYTSRDIYDTMRKILSIAITEYHNDKRAADIVSEVFFSTTEKLAEALRKMTDLDLVEPIDIKIFTSFHMAISLSATFPLNGSHTVNYDNWKGQRQFLISLIHEKTPATT